MINKIRKDSLQARKNKDKEVAKILTTLLSEIDMRGKNEGNRETTEKEAQEIISKFVKNINEVLKNENDTEKQDIIKKEKLLYESYLPQQLSSSELVNIVKNCINNDGLDMGGIMKFLKKNYMGEYNGREAAAIIKELI